MLVHVALSPAGLVVAHFISWADCAAYCRDQGATHLPFNLANRDRAGAPLVGTTYRA